MLLSEHFQKYCSHAVRKRGKAVFLSLGFVLAQLQGSLEPAPSPKPRPNPKILAPRGYSISSNAPAGHPPAGDRQKGGEFFRAATQGGAHDVRLPWATHISPRWGFRIGAARKGRPPSPKSSPHNNVSSRTTLIRLRHLLPLPRAKDGWRGLAWWHALRCEMAIEVSNAGTSQSAKTWQSAKKESMPRTVKQASLTWNDSQL